MIRFCDNERSCRRLTGETVGNLDGDYYFDWELENGEGWEGSASELHRQLDGTCTGTLGKHKLVLSEGIVVLEARHYNVSNAAPDENGSCEPWIAVNDQPCRLEVIRATRAGSCDGCGS